MTMRILNVRLGLATNSSSTHSIIFLPGAKDALVNGSSCFGWENFVCASPQAKKDYLAACIYENLRKEGGEDVALTVARAWSDGGRITKDSYVDHQSHLTLPRTWEGRGLDLAFVEDFRAFLLREGIVVAGGNDNDDGNPIWEEGRSLGLRKTMPIEDYTPWVARKDPSGYWTLFHRTSGAKLRVVLDEAGLTAKADRAAAPELVDIKITDFCPYGCGYCYQGSTHAGKHADKERLSSLALALGDLRVFEVALGGGEPTLHPQFMGVLESFGWRQVVVNFTTKNLTWIKAHGRDAVMSRKVGAIAYSAETAKDVDALAEVLSDWPREMMGHDEGVHGINVQHVVGLKESSLEFEALLERCHRHKLRVTLLGFKSTGRGGAYRQQVAPIADLLASIPPSTVVSRTVAAEPKKKTKAPPWLQIVASLCKKKGLQVGIDTALADEHWQHLLAAGVPEWCMTRKEGQFSCYIDAVAGKIGPSSYCDPEQMVDLPGWIGSEALQGIYQGFATPEAP